MKRALVTGVTGQDGSYLAESLLSKGYKVFGMRRRSASENTDRIDAILDDIEMISGDLADSSSLNKAIRESKPDEVYNLAAQSFVAASFAQPEYTLDVTGTGVVRLLEAVRLNAPGARFYQASSSEMFGSATPPQSEETRFHPRSPYGCAKVCAYWATVNYREMEGGLFACNGILFNHESPRRGIEFVTQKIATGVAAIKLGLQPKLALGNLDAKRDWGHARDYVEAMYLMLQQDEAKDYVVATGEAHSVREFCEIAFSHLGMNYEDHVVVDPIFFRPAEVDFLMGDPSLAKKDLGWEPSTSFEDLVTEMVDEAMKTLSSKKG